MGTVACEKQRHLPCEISSFVERRGEMAALHGLLRSCRLVTLTGVGGVGKSRLALRMAHRVRREFPEGVCLVGLAQLRTPSLLAATVAEALGLVELSARDPASVLQEYLAGKRLLLVLDDCEHMASDCGVLVDTLLRAAPKLRILTTSRWPLHVLGEQLWPVAPLSLSDPVDLTGAASRCEAVALFEQRAAAVRADFTVDASNLTSVTRVCQHLDGLPLAIELAAVRMRAMSIDALLARLDKRLNLLSAGGRTASGRYQTLRETMEASYELCTAEQKILWQRLSVFAGGADLSAVEAVCTDDAVPTDDVVLDVSGLVDQSVLLRSDAHGKPRYRLPEILRHYGQERLRESADEPWLRQRHRDHYLRLAEQADADWFGPRQLDWLRRLQAERANLQTALEYCRTQPGQTTIGLRLASSLWCYWIGRGLLTEGRYWLEQMLTLESRPSRERARALWVLAWIAEVQGQPSETLRLAKQCRREAQELDDQRELAYAAQFTGSATNTLGHPTEGLTLLEHALTQHHAADAVTSAALLAFVQLTFTAEVAENIERALALLTQCREQCEAHGERWTLSWTLWRFGFMYWSQGDYEQANQCLRDSLRIMRDFDNRLGIPFCVEVLAWIAAATDDTVRAARLLGACPMLWQPVRQPLFGSPTLLDYHEQCEDRTRTALGNRAFSKATRDGEQLSLDAAIHYALGQSPNTNNPPSAAPTSPLTPREREISELIALGLTNKDIATELVISRRTVDTHVEHILTKLDFTSRAQIAAWTAERPTTDQTRSLPSNTDQ